MTADHQPIVTGDHQPIVTGDPAIAAAHDRPVAAEDDRPSRAMMTQRSLSMTAERPWLPTLRACVLQLHRDIEALVDRRHQVARRTAVADDVALGSRLLERT